MIAVLICLGFACGWLLIQYIRSILEIRFLYRQLEELERGSHIEIGVHSRQKDVLELCRKLNHLQKLQEEKWMQYEKAEKQMKQNITSLAHDIRTPLTGAAGYVQLAQECQERDRQEHYLDAADRRLHELGDMLEELFLYTKLTGEDFALNIQEMQVLPLLSDCLVGRYRELEEKGISPEISFESEGVRVWADEECLRRIFQNLIQNALVHGTGEITIRQFIRNVSDDLPKTEISGDRKQKEWKQKETEKKEAGADGRVCMRGRVCLVFENTVSETSRPDPKQIFDRFYKADSARRKGSSGLGLFIVKELMERMNGRVKAETAGRKLRILLEFGNEIRRV